MFQNVRVVAILWNSEANSTPQSQFCAPQHTIFALRQDVLSGWKSSQPSGKTITMKWCTWSAMMLWYMAHVKVTSTWTAGLKFPSRTLPKVSQCLLLAGVWDWRKVLVEFKVDKPCFRVHISRQSHSQIVCGRQNQISFVILLH